MERRVDPLQGIRDRFFIGAYAAALDEIKNFQGNNMTEIEKKAFEARSYLILGKYSKLKELQNSTEPSLKCTALLTMFLKSKDPARRQLVLKELKELATTTKDPTAIYLAACACATSNEFVEAIELTHTCGQVVDIQSLRAQLCVLMNRMDLADKQMREINKIDDEIATARMISALVHFGLKNYQESFLLYCDLETQFGDDLNTKPSSLIVNGKACSNMQRGNFAEATEDLGRHYAPDRTDSDTLVNLISSSMHTNNMENADKYLNELKKGHPDHKICQKLAQLEQIFAN